MDSQQVTQIALAANASSIGLAKANEFFKNSLAAALTVTVSLRACDSDYVKKTTTFPVSFSPKKVVTNDHSALVAVRELTREAYEKAYSINHTNLSTLCIGATSREIRKYNSNPAIRYFVAGEEAKDINRFITVVQNDIIKICQTKMNKSNKLIHPGVKSESSVCMRLKGIRDVVTLYDKIGSQSGRIYLTPVKSDLLLFEDSFYNYDEMDYCKIFHQTGAKVAYGYGMLPFELIFPDMPPNSIYHLRRHTVDGKDRATLTYQGGYCNGYTHEHNKWSTMLREVAWKRIVDNEEVAIMVEIVARVGPMAVFTLTRFYHTEVFCRTLELPDSLKYIRIMDVLNSFDLHNNKLKAFSQCRFFAVNEIEFFEVLNYALALDEKSLTLQNVLSYIRRRIGGISTIAKEFVAPMQLKKTDVAKMALCVFLYAVHCNYNSNKITSNFNRRTFWTWLCDKCHDKRFLGLALTPTTLAIGLAVVSGYGGVMPAVFSTCVTVLQYVVGLITDNSWLVALKEFVGAVAVGYTPLFVLTTWLLDNPNNYDLLIEESSILGRKDDFVKVGLSKIKKHGDVLESCTYNPGLILDVVSHGDGKNAADADMLNCDLCANMDGKMGDQRMICNMNLNSDHEFKLTDDEIQTMLAELADTDMDAQGLKAVKEQAKTYIPKGGFSKTARVRYVRGGPGCGKSVLIRNMIEEGDVVIAPFSKLMADYTNMKRGDEDLKIPFKTNHRALMLTSANVVYVDEFTSMDYRFLAIIMYNTDADEVVLVGDHSQCRIQQDEGVYIGDRINMDALDTHTLVVNFRNPADIVAKLNKDYGYMMHSTREKRCCLKLLNMRAHDETFDLEELNVREACFEVAMAEGLRDIPANMVMQCIKDINDPVNFREECAYIRGDAVNRELYNQLVASDYDGYTKMAFSKTMAEQYCGNARATVRSFQGSTVAKTALFVGVNDVTTLCRVESLMIVALSRHKEEIVILCENGHTLRTLSAQLGFTEQFYQHINTHITLPEMDKKLVCIEDKVVKEALVEYRSTRDAYLNIKDYFPKICELEVDAINSVGSRIVKTGRKIKTNMTKLFGKMNQRGHPEEDGQINFGLCCGIGQQFYSDKYIELNTMSTRYDNAEDAYECDSEARTFAQDLVEKFFFDNKKSDFSINNIPDVDIVTIAEKALHDASVRNYCKRYVGEGGDDSDVTQVSFYIKPTFKPASNMKPVDSDKVGQGISGWSTTLTSKFFIATRILQYLDKLTDRQDDAVAIHTDDGLSELEFQDQVKTSFGRVLGAYPAVVVKHMVTDGVMFDSKQNEFTQAVERHYLKLLGVDDSFIEDYFSVRNGLTCNGEYSTVTMGYEMTSGQPMTKMTNGIVAKVFSHAIVKMEGNYVMLYKGDDFCKSGINPRVDEEVKRKMALYCPLEVRAEAAETVEFCGAVVTNEGMFPNLRRKIFKIGGARFRSYQHFCEYQQSLRDFVRYVRDVGVDKVLEVNVKCFAATYHDAESMLEIVDSYGHINEQQFWNVMQVIPRDTVDVQRSSEDGLLEIVIQ